MTEDRLYIELGKLNIEVSDVQKEQLKMYYELLVEWNQKMNLTAITDKEQVYLKHFYDSATIAKVIDLKSNISLCDVGTGAGFPGIVLKILFPNLKITLVDALNKRVLFLKEVIERLHLTNIEAIHARIEEYAREVREQFDVVTSRAVASLPVLMEYSIPLVKKGGYFIPMKGDITQEIKDSSTAMSLLNVKLICQESFLLPIENSQRTLLKFQKLDKTSVKYPRKFSEIKRKHL